MPTYARTARFRRGYRRLGPAEQRAFLAVVVRFVESLTHREFDPALRVKRVQGTRGVWEITWAPDGRATFFYRACGGVRHLVHARLPGTLRVASPESEEEQRGTSLSEPPAAEDHPPGPDRRG